MTLSDRFDRVLTRYAHIVVFAPHAWANNGSMIAALMSWRVMYCEEIDQRVIARKEVTNREGWSAIVLSLRSSTVAMHVRRRAALMTGSCLALSL